MRIYIRSSGILLKMEGTQLIAVGEKTSTPINLSRLNELWVHPDTVFSGGVIASLGAAGIKVVFLNSGLAPVSIMNRLDFPSGALLRKKQLMISLDPLAHHLAAGYILRKQQHQIKVLMALGVKTSETWFLVLRDIVSRSKGMLDKQSLLQPNQLQEAYFARLYFRAVNRLLPLPFRFARRSRNPAMDPANAMLNYGYGILYARITNEIRQANLDPYIGFWHVEQNGHPVLSYDMIEVFRPRLEALVFEGFQSGLWKERDFVIEAVDGCTISHDARQKLAELLLQSLQEEKNRDGRDPIEEEVYHLVNRIHRFPLSRHQTL